MLRRLSHQQGLGNVDEAHAAVVARENDLPTIVAPGMAMPHARLDTVRQIVVAVATSKAGIVYDANRPDNRVKLIVLTLAPKGAPGVYLQALSCLARICHDPATADTVAHLPTPEEVWTFFDHGGTAPSDHPHVPGTIDPVQIDEFLGQ
jgi:mannitol/fructose-specific phosphotransferase system IIA component (Ntr-type)